MTDFGRDVLEVIEPVSTRTVDGPRVGANDAISVQVLSLADIETDTDACQTEVNESQFEQINAVPFSQIHSITRVTSYLPFVLPETGIFKFTLSTGAGDGDPFLVLMDEKCTLIPTVIDQNPCAHLRMPRDMIFHGWSMRLFQAWQHSATMSS